MPYSTRSCIVIEPATPFMGFLVQLEPFDYSSLKIIDRQKLVYEMYREEQNFKPPSPSRNHKCTIQIDGVRKISVNRVIGTSDFFM